MKCSNCGALEMHKDEARGSIYCEECGMVQEENTVVSTLQFDTSSTKAVLHGKIINVENTNIGTKFIDSSYYIKNTIRSICQKLSLGDSHVDSAFRWYKLCLQYSLSKGKSILYTLSACVYLTCRQESTPHLLIDFSSELRIDLFKIGKVFLKIRSLLGVDIPLIDPSLYMHRFVSQLKFKNKEILNFSILLVSRMRKDWILEGRRPNNSCGAALLIASRIFNEERSIVEIAKVVYASTATINKRLEEIKETESADLKIDQFMNTWIENEAYPPIFKQNALNEIIAMDNDKMGDILIMDTPKENEVNESKYKKENINYKDNEFVVPDLILNDDESKYRREDINYKDDDFEVQDLILNDNESKIREDIWESMYGEYLREVQEKKKNAKKTAVRKYSKRHNFNTVEEAIKSLDRKVSSKLNYVDLESLFNPS